MKASSIFSFDEFERIYSHDTSEKIFGYFLAILFWPLKVIIFLFFFVVSFIIGAIIGLLKRFFNYLRTRPHKTQ